MRGFFAFWALGASCVPSCFLLGVVSGEIIRADFFFSVALCHFGCWAQLGTLFQKRVCAISSRWRRGAPDGTRAR